MGLKNFIEVNVGVYNYPMGKMTDVPTHIEVVNVDHIINFDNNLIYLSDGSRLEVSESMKEIKQKIAECNIYHYEIKGGSEFRIQNIKP